MIRRALISDRDFVYRICADTISAIYPHYYPEGAVAFFLAHHNAENIAADLQKEIVYLICSEEHPVGTVTVRDNEICRLFVLPSCQGKGYGRELLDFAEKIISTQYSEILLSASLPTKQMYLNRGYKEISYHRLLTGNGDFLCYDNMKKNVRHEHEKERSGNH